MSPVDTIQGASGNGLPIPRLDPGEPATDQIFSAPRLILASLSGLACLAALQALALPRWPEAAPLAEPAVLASLRRAGLEVRALPSSPGQRSSELARGPRLRFQLRDGATTASLQLLPAQVRQRANFQLALISRGQPSLALPPGLHLRSDGSVAYVEGHLGNQQLRQTCLVSLPPGVTSGPSSNGATRSAAPAMAASTPIPVGGVSAAQLGAAADRGASGGLVTISRIVGLSPNRNFGCLLVSLGMENGRKDEGASAAGMERLWDKILPVLATF
jgi:hypothetical protein